MAETLDFDALYGVARGKHLYQFYKSSEDYLRVLLAYFHAGLEKGEACLWLVSESMGIRKVLDACRAEIPGTDAYLAKRQFQIRSAEAWYLTDGHFDEARALANARDFVTEVNQAGFQNIRGSGDAGAIPHEEWSKLPSYEIKIEGFVRQCGIIALCAYPILECSISDTRSVLEHHDSVLVGRI